MESIIVNGEDGSVDLEIGATVDGNIDFGGDTDLYEISVTEGATYQIDMTSATSGTGSLADGKLRVVDADGTTLFEDDDSGRGLESRLTFTAETSGILFVEASAFGSEQTERISSASPRPPRRRRISGIPSGVRLRQAPRLPSARPSRGQSSSTETRIPTPTISKPV